jgi:hypothetical protein
MAGTLRYRERTWERGNQGERDEGGHLVASSSVQGVFSVGSTASRRWPASSRGKTRRCFPVPTKKTKQILQIPPSFGEFLR